MTRRSRRLAMSATTADEDRSAEEAAASEPSVPGPSASAPSAGAHPSAPIPTGGPPIGASLRVPLGACGLDVFPVMLGAAELGWRVDERLSRAILDRYAGLGGNVLHTSAGFADGASERLIGRWLAARGGADGVVLAVRAGRHPDDPGLGAAGLVRAVESSLSRLGAERIDVLYLDRPAGDDTPMEDVLATADWLVRRGMVGTLGARGLTVGQLMEARVLASTGYPRIDVVDVPYNLMDRRGLSADLRLLARAQGLALTPSRSLQHGFLSGRHRSRSALVDVPRSEQLRESLSWRGARTLKALDRVAARAQVPDAAVAVAWLLAHPPVDAAVVGAHTVQHVEEAARGVGVRLTRADLAGLDRAARR